MGEKKPTLCQHQDDGSGDLTIIQLALLPGWKHYVKKQSLFDYLPYLSKVAPHFGWQIPAGAVPES